MDERQTGKSNSGRTYSCPRDLRLSAIMDAQFRAVHEALRTNTVLCRIEGGPQVGSHYAERLYQSVLNGVYTDTPSENAQSSCVCFESISVVIGLMSPLLVTIGPLIDKK